jgi:hypothetical protein
MHKRCLLLWLCSAAVAVGCATPAVGDPCLPEQVPDNGFDDSEAYVESSSVQCETRVCLVDHLEGDPRKECADRPDAVRCAQPDEVEDRVYCSCRCDSDDTGFAECECPSGFTCAPVLKQGNAGVRGGYCLRDSSLARQ